MEEKDLDKLDNELKNSDLSSVQETKEAPSDDNIEKVLDSDSFQEETFNQDLSDELIDNSIQQEEMKDAVINSDTKEDIQEMITVRPVKFQEFEPSEPNRAIKKNLDIIQDVSMHVSVELGKSKATIKDVMEYKEGSIVELDKIAGEQVEIYVNNKLVARGEVIVIEDKFGVRVTTTNLPKTIQ